MSFLKIFKIKAVGVTIKKKIIPIIIGETIFPKKIPNLNQILFNGVSKKEFISPKNKKIKLKTKDQSLISDSWKKNGYKEIIKKNIKKTIPKLLLELILIFSEVK